MRMRRFRFKRLEDESGVSGTGYVAEGCEYTDGRIAIRWTTRTGSWTLYENIKEAELIHGHGGKTVIEWIDTRKDEGHDDEDSSE